MTPKVADVDLLAVIGSSAAGNQRLVVFDSSASIPCSRASADISQRLTGSVKTRPNRHCQPHGLLSPCHHPTSFLANSSAEAGRLRRDIRATACRCDAVVSAERGHFITQYDGDLPPWCGGKTRWPKPTAASAQRQLSALVLQPQRLLVLSCRARSPQLLLTPGKT